MTVSGESIIVLCIGSPLRRCQHTPHGGGDLGQAGARSRADAGHVGEAVHLAGDAAQLGDAGGGEGVGVGFAFVAQGIEVQPAMACWWQLPNTGARSQSPPEAL